MKAAALLFLFAGFASAEPPICAKCHPKETARFLATPMGRSIVPPSASPPGHITHRASDAVIDIGWKDGRMVHRVSERGLTSEHAIDYQIGGGLMGRGYLIQTRGYVFESPVSWYNKYGWDVSPGYARAAVLDFDRSIDETCLFCHADNPRYTDADRKHVEDALSAISCDRCHGSGTEHVRRPLKTNIINPARLRGPARDSICEQCHLEGASRILNPGKNWGDFRPGAVTEDTFATYLVRGNTNGEVIAVSQAEQLRESQCARATQGRLWCGSCHHPHGVTTDRAQEIRSVCTSCHATLSAAAHPQRPRECTSCHMPKTATTDIQHAALTDHRILRRPTAAQTILGGQAEAIVFWREPDSLLRNRDLGLAEIAVGTKRQLRAMVEHGLGLLESVPAEQRWSDPAVLSPLAALYVQRGKMVEGEQAARRLLDLSPRSARAALAAGLVFTSAGDVKAAEQQFARAVELDPSLRPAYMQLAMLYQREGRQHEMLATIDRYLSWNPQDFMFRTQKAVAAGQ